MVIASFFEQPTIQNIPAKKVRVMIDFKRIGGYLGFKYG
jgi:hypothetical protein